MRTQGIVEEIIPVTQENTKNPASFALSPHSFLTHMIRAEVNLEKLPFFVSSKNHCHGIEDYILRKTIAKEGMRTEIEWRIIPSAKYGLPDYFDRDVYRAMQKIMDTKGVPGNGWIAFSVYEIINILKFDRSGHIRTKIKESLKRIKHTGIESKGAIFLKEKQQWLEGIFSPIFDSLVFIGEKMADGSIAETNYVHLSQWYLDNLKGGYLKPLDIDYYFSLKNPIAKALYSFLSCSFYGLPENIPYKKKYSDLCQEIMITYQKYQSDAKKILEKSRQELVATGFLKKVEYAELPDNNNDFYVLFYPGKRFQEPALFETTKQTPFPVMPDMKEGKSYSLNKEACELIAYFQQKHNNESEYSASVKELQEAIRLIKEQGLQIARFIVDYALKEAPKTGFKMRFFTAVTKTYAEKAIQNYYRKQQSQAKEHERTLHTVQDSHERKKHRETYDRAEELFRQLSAGEQKRIEREAKKRLMSKHGYMNEHFILRPAWISEAYELISQEKDGVI